MSYAAGEAAIRDVIIAGSTLFASNTVVSLANNTPDGGQHRLDTGAADIYVFLEENGFSSEGLSLRETIYTWGTSIEIWTRYRAPGESEARRDAARQSVIDAFAACEDLNSNAISGARITTGDRYVTLRAEGRQSGAPTWFMQRLNMTWKEHV